VSVSTEIAERLVRVREGIAEAARAAGREPEAIRLVAVCKQQPLMRIRSVLGLGVRDLGENTAQGMRATATALAGHDIRWHFIGALQHNKVNVVLRHAHWIQSVGRWELAQALAKRAAAEVQVLVQVNIGREPHKAGVAPEGALELACRIASLPRLRLRGLMAIPPVDQASEPFFEAMQRLSQELQRTPEGKDAQELSLGMSGDFATAIRFGATMVRIGTALFGPRDSRHSDGA
jgi:pyridoxal phosphate enzyme (YggS family)